MYRLFFFCLFINLIEANGWRKPYGRFTSNRHRPWNHYHHHNGHQNQDTRPCACNEEENPITHIPDVTEEPVTENGRTPFREDEDQKEPDRTPENTWEYLGNKTVSNNKVNKNYCKIHSKDGALEYFTTHNYKLIIPLKDYDGDDIIVKTKNNMVYIKGTIPDVDIDVRFEEDDKNEFEAIYKVPDIVDVKRVSWYHVKGKLKITFLYKIQFDKEVPKSCDGDYNVDDELRVARQEVKNDISTIMKILNIKNLQ